MDGHVDIPAGIPVSQPEHCIKQWQERRQRLGTAMITHPDIGHRYLVWYHLYDLPPGQPVVTWMDTWTYQPGFPFVNLSIVHDDGDGSGSGMRLIASQVRDMCHSRASIRSDACLGKTLTSCSGHFGHFGSQTVRLGISAQHGHNRYATDCQSGERHVSLQGGQLPGRTYWHSLLVNSDRQLDMQTVSQTGRLATRAQLLFNSGSALVLCSSSKQFR